jgi:hypothetical protein
MFKNAAVNMARGTAVFWLNVSFWIMKSVRFAFEYPYTTAALDYIN